MRIPTPRPFAALAAAALLAPAAASAQSYPEPSSRPRCSQSRRARTRPYTVCKSKRRCDFTTIQKAVDKARAGDTIRVRNGVYREAVRIDGSRSATCG